MEAFAVANRKRAKLRGTRRLSFARFTEEDLTHFETVARIERRRPVQKFRSTLRAASQALVGFMRARAGGEQREEQRRKGLSLISKGAEMLDPWQLHYLLAGFDLTDAVERNDRRAESALRAPELTRAFCERLKQSKSPRRRPRSVEFDHFVHSVGKAYLEATGRPPRRGGRFAALLETVVERLGLNPRRCDNAIKRVFRKQPKELR
jgi:hypothetical protein